MSSIGEKLQAARENLDLTLHDVCAATRINLKYLQAMERDDRSAFPAGFFYRSFVMQYVRKLGLNEAAISAELDRVLAAEAPLPLPGQHPGGGDWRLKRMVPVTSRPRFPGTGRVLAPVASFVLVLAGCTGLYALWRNVRQDSFRNLAARIGIAHTNRTVKTPARAKAAPAPPQPAVSTPSPLDAQAQPAQPADLSPVPVDSKLLLNLSASEATWLSVSADGKAVFSGILQPNESKKLGALTRAKLVVGNAGGLSVEWNGKAIGTLGRRGQVRVVSFTPEAYTFLDSADRARPARDSGSDGGADSTR